MSKMKTHDLPCLHVRAIRPLKAGATYALEWSDASRGFISVRAAGLIVECWHRGAYVNQVVFTETTPRNFGGRQVWFTCPGCWRRCSILYLSERLACRLCLQLAYRSQSEGVLNRSYRKSAEDCGACMRREDEQQDTPGVGNEIGTRRASSDSVACRICLPTNWIRQPGLNYSPLNNSSTGTFSPSAKRSIA